jgi:hypothetical protein
MLKSLFILIRVKQCQVFISTTQYFQFFKFQTGSKNGNDSRNRIRQVPGVIAVPFRVTQL